MRPTRCVSATSLMWCICRARFDHSGCGSVEEVILRDVPRTFPEHPLFNTADGQQRLLRVLKAYAAADPEVSVVPVRLACHPVGYFSASVKTIACMLS